MTLLDDVTGADNTATSGAGAFTSPIEPAVDVSFTPPRMIAIWCPDWPVAAALAGVRAGTLPATIMSGGTLPAHTLPASILPVSTTDHPVAVVTANHVVACSHPARAAGVRRGMRRREAQSRCPELLVLPRDEAMEARIFEPIVAAIESIAPGVEITRPGLVAIGARGPSRYFGSEDAVLHALSRTLSSLCELSADVLIGVGDGAFAAEQAARRGLVIPTGQSAEFLAELPVEIVDAPELVDLLRRLGICTLGAFAALPARDVLARFGPTGAWIHRQCGGRDVRPIAARQPAVEHTVDIAFEPPLDRIDSIAFSVRTSAERFINGLLDHGLACTCLELIAQTENGEQTVRRWRQAGVLSAVDVLDRVRWQLEGWLNGHSADQRSADQHSTDQHSTDQRSADQRNADQRGERPTGGVSLVRLVAAQCVPTGVHQQSLWSATGDNDERAHRALARVQTLLGHGSVLTAVVDGGHDPGQRTTLVPWGDEPAAHHAPSQPWPGHLPAPTPSVLIDPPRRIRVLDDRGQPVTVTARGAVPVAPAQLDLGQGSGFPPSREQPSRKQPGRDQPGGEQSGREQSSRDQRWSQHGAVAITAWAGPWPVDDTWWSAPGSSTSTPASTVPALPQRRARFQLVDIHGRAYLVVCAFGSGGGPATNSWSPPGAGTESAPATDIWTLEAIYD